ncbi:hypothetical protein [Algibacter mikhailovii]|uniref:hypothetical protein n=1 Tax=Algibacter mikhailovii TaxID=425498 RepID=UPI0024948245|nr:hypothetical protein [Algibacter mikhailovii]
MNELILKRLIYLILIVFSFGNVFSQDKQKSADDIARELSNPIGTLANFTFQGTYAQWGGSAPGASNQNTSSFVFMPTLPFKLWGGNLSVRPSFPFQGAPFVNDQGVWDATSGFGDIGLMALYGKATESGFIWGFGPTLFFPTAGSNLLGKDQFQVGPAVLAGILRKWGVLGALWQHWWGVGSIDSNTDRVNLGTVQLFYWFSAGKGWQIGGSPNQSANYVQGQDIEFSIPLNLGFAKTVVLGKMPLKFSLQGQYFLTQPEVIGPNWGIFFSITPVIKVPW